VTHPAIEAGIRAHMRAFEALGPSDFEAIDRVARVWYEALRGGNKVLLFGNGGSAADSQHLAAELVGRFAKERKALPAIALTVNTSNITAIANDYSYDDIFARQLEAQGRPGDVAVGISTSGNSPNVVKALERGRGAGIRTVAFTGKKGGKCAPIAEVVLRAPSDETPRIQEYHITAGHVICAVVEEVLFPSS